MPTASQPFQSPASHHVLLGLGTNLGDRAGMLAAAGVGLRRFLHVTAESSVYETAPMYVTDQNAFLNMAVTAQTSMTPHGLLAALQALEARLGRVPGPRYGPRCIDIDILLFDSVVMDEPDLILPHPRFAERPFALVPASDIAGGWRHPTVGATVRQLRAAVDSRAGIRPASGAAAAE